jgi:hypothetical protein
MKVTFDDLRKIRETLPSAENCRDLEYRVPFREDVCSPVTILEFEKVGMIDGWHWQLRQPVQVVL